jgi:hypothetical protein
MSSATASATEQALPIYLDARLILSRLVTERASSPAPGPVQEQKSVQARAESGTQIEIGLHPADAPNSLTITLSYKVSIKAEGIEKPIGEYECSYFSAFRIARAFGITDWNKLPLSVVAPYVGTTAQLAIRRAEATLQEMGINGGPLPRPELRDSEFSVSPVAS